MKRAQISYLRWVAMELLAEGRRVKRTPLEVVNVTSLRARFLGRLRLEQEVPEEILRDALGLALGMLRRAETRIDEIHSEASNYLPKGWEVLAEEGRIKPCKCLTKIEAEWR